mmetsp:Transcript_18722/g.50765  ORF Transcript_18722/g.50765 Transcript_18722/m.50765 type:complete len:246 (-) Transcript_18722:3304-4041(-)
MPPLAPISASVSPVKTAHSLSPKSCGWSRWIRCIAYVSRSSLKSERETEPKTSCCSSGPSERTRSSGGAWPSWGALSALSKSSRNMGSEYLYIGLMRSRSSSVKKRREPTSAIGRKTLRCESSDSCSCDDSSSLALILLADALSSLSESMSFLFSRMLPSDSASSVSSRCSIPSSSILSWSSAASSVDFFDSSSGCSCWMVRPSSCSSRPDAVTEKLTSETSDDTSAGSSGCGLRVVRNMRNDSL